MEASPEVLADQVVDALRDLESSGEPAADRAGPADARGGARLPDLRCPSAAGTAAGVPRSPTARLLIVGQAPGTKVHATGIPWNDPSGDRLRRWLAMDRSRFYDESRIAIVPMGLCYPGRLPNGGDAPPRPECALYGGNGWLGDAEH